MPYRSPQNFNNAINNFFFVLPPFMVSSFYKTPLGESIEDKNCRKNITSILDSSDVDESLYEDYMFQECCENRNVSFEIKEENSIQIKR